MTERPVVVLPHPDSPTMPRHSPSLRTNETSSTAATVVARIANSVRRLLTSRSAIRAKPTSAHGWPLLHRRAGARGAPPPSERCGDPQDGAADRHASRVSGRRLTWSLGSRISRACDYRDGTVTPPSSTRWPRCRGSGCRGRCVHRPRRHRGLRRHGAYGRPCRPRCVGARPERAGRRGRGHPRPAAPACAWIRWLRGQPARSTTSPAPPRGSLGGGGPPRPGRSLFLAIGLVAIAAVAARRTSGRGDGGRSRSSGRSGCQHARADRSTLRGPAEVERSPSSLRSCSWRLAVAAGFWPAAADRLRGGGGRSAASSSISAHAALEPVEERIVSTVDRRGASGVLAQVHPSVVAITGSYGKTSTKHHLAELVGAPPPVVPTPGASTTARGSRAR